jgi:serine/threonine-protein kinase
MEHEERLKAALADRYRIEQEIGSGGMATVYLAEDVKHHRKVAIKVLHPELAAVIGGERFLREIEIAAGLAHPRILPLHDSGAVDGLLFYVMPFVEGESLRDRLNREKQLPLDHAVRIARDVAYALSHAHGKGVVHRDIKPENILLSGNEAVVADFGIARAVKVAGGERLTETGLSLGTPQYMSPEQAGGDADPDGRSDIYSLGCVLFEMLAGEPPYTGPTTQAILAKVLTEKPRDIRTLRDTAPLALTRVLEKALARLPADRFSAASDFANALPPPERLEERTGVTGEGLAQEARVRFATSKMVWPLVVALALIVAVVQTFRSSDIPRQITATFDITFPTGYELVGGSPPLAISPDGKSVVFSARRGGVSQLFLRRLDDPESHPLPGTEGAHTPFFSPDGEWIGFVGVRTIMKVAVSGGSPIPVGDAPFVSLGAVWAPGVIVLGGVGVGLKVISDEGGDLESLTSLDAVRGEVSHGWPQALPDGETIMFTIGSGEGSRTATVSLETGDVRFIEGIDGATGARYVPTGHLVFAMGEDLVAAEFDVRNLEVSGLPRSLVEGVHGARSGTFARFSYFSVSSTGTLIFVPGGVESGENTLVWKELDGDTTPVTEHRGSHFYPHLSPDGRFIAVQEGNEIWIYDPARGTRNRLTSGGGTDPVWTPDGERITFAAGREGRMSLHWIRADGSGAAEHLYAREHPLFPNSWSPDGSVLAFYEVNPATARDVWVLTQAGDDWEARPFLATPANERSPFFSPDGQWIAYVSDKSGRDEVYVRPYPGPGGEWPISRDGGREPVWPRNGESLYYRQGSNLMAVPVQTGEEVVAGEPRLVVSGGYQIEFTASGSQTYDVSPDGSAILFTESVETTPPATVRVVLNWFEELTDRVGGTGQ